jgi:hypothetical protein
MVGVPDARSFGVDVHAKSGGQAHHCNGGIYMPASSPVPTVIHALGHALKEALATVHKAAIEFPGRPTRGEQLRSLWSITGISRPLSQDKWLYCITEVLRESVDHVCGGAMYDVCCVMCLTKCELQPPIHLYANGHAVSGFAAVDLFPVHRLFEEPHVMDDTIQLAPRTPTDDGCRASDGHSVAPHAGPELPVLPSNRRRSPTPPRFADTPVHHGWNATAHPRPDAPERSASSGP